MLSPEANELLTRVGPGTPAGQLLRRYWQPVCLARELTETNPKKRVQIMGEELVVFRLRSESGRKEVRYGCVAEHCPHRGTSLYYGDGITMYRKLLREQIEFVQRGGEPMALVHETGKNRIISFDSTKPVLE